MKITDPQVIKNGEKELIAAVQKNLDLKTVKKILKDRMAETSFLSKGGQIVVHDNQIAFRLDFDLNLSGSLFFDRQGNHITDSSEPKSSFYEKALDDDQDNTPLPLEEDMDEAFLADLDDDDDPDMPLDEKSAADEDPADEDIEYDSLGLEEDSLDQDDMLDDDINDILKESREFWEQKKDS
ncbi:MAG: hypothetical protein K9K21_07540 [Desulfotignum sp.]|nr:hypothetical protein [Desulfotignum sp.]MCF8113685.1 hypothetical protein [Desulfotignum sp.]MCF8126244.1 hypothetical protein [Desulfotignum sp.]